MKVTGKFRLLLLVVVHGGGGGVFFCFFLVFLGFFFTAPCSTTCSSMHNLTISGHVSKAVLFIRFTKLSQPVYMNRTVNFLIHNCFYDTISVDPLHARHQC